MLWVNQYGLLQIYHSLQQRKNFANRSRTDKVIAMVRVTDFFGSLCISNMYLKYLYFKQFTTLAVTEQAVASFSHHTWSAAVQQVCRTRLTTVHALSIFHLLILVRPWTPVVVQGSMVRLTPGPKFTRRGDDLPNT